VERALPGADNDEAAFLRHYTLVKQEVAASVRAAKQLFQARGAKWQLAHGTVFMVTCGCLQDDISVDPYVPSRFLGNAR